MNRKIFELFLLISFLFAPYRLFNFNLKLLQDPVLFLNFTLNWGLLPLLGSVAAWMCWRKFRTERYSLSFELILIILIAAPFQLGMGISLILSLLLFLFLCSSLNQTQRMIGGLGIAILASLMMIRLEFTPETQYLKAIHLFLPHPEHAPKFLRKLANFYYFQAEAFRSTTQLSRVSSLGMVGGIGFLILALKSFDPRQRGLAFGFVSSISFLGMSSVGGIPMSIPWVVGWISAWSYIALYEPKLKNFTTHLSIDSSLPQ